MSLYVHKMTVIGGDPRMLDLCTALTCAQPRHIPALDRIEPAAQFGVTKHIKWTVEQGNKIEAIKLVRILTDWSLKDSKDWVELVADVFPPSSSARDFTK